MLNLFVPLCSSFQSTVITLNKSAFSVQLVYLTGILRVGGQTQLTEDVTAQGLILNN